MAAGTAMADLSVWHSLNPSWPPHARLHTIWNVLHLAATQSLAVVLLWTGSGRSLILRVRIATLLILAVAVSFFVSALVAPAFGASLLPDLPAHRMPPRLLGLDGNLLSFLVATPVVVLGWWLCERSHDRFGDGTSG